MLSSLAPALANCVSYLSKNMLFGSLRRQRHHRISLESTPLAFINLPLYIHFNRTYYFMAQWGRILYTMGTLCASMMIIISKQNVATARLFPSFAAVDSTCIPCRYRAICTYVLHIFECNPLFLCFRVAKRFCIIM